ncbi:MAG TPA: DNA-formamidopyrimidine glycosylase [Firmicutes bacterium]|jgi:formamidopyrimidine-DNA glycosylase|nr:DNA-formamidopyrimidine glycosylase [Bacillota bacterium]
MPELPEVETIRRSLTPLITGKRIEDVSVYLPKAIRGRTPEELRQELMGKIIAAVDRRGKYLLLCLKEGGTLVFHLRMTGRVIFRATAEEPLAKHTTLVLDFAGGAQLRFEDPRKFGTVDLLSDHAHHAMDLLGPEPLGGKWTLDDLIKAGKTRKTCIKAVLLDQAVVAGLGNIYTDESLFRAGIYPGRPASSLSQEEWQRLYGIIQEVLAEGIEYRGTTHRDYVDGLGNAGGFQERLRVYGRSGLPCVNCGTPIRRKKLAGRGTHYCPKCQHAEREAEA